MKKFFALIVTLLVLSSCSCSFGEVVGSLSKPGADSGNAIESVKPLQERYVLAELADEGLKSGNVSMKFYDSLTILQLALNKGDIGAFTSPEFVGEYMLRSNPDYKIRGFVVLKLPVALAFGFLEEKKELRDRFSKVIEDLEREGVIGIIARDYITGPAAVNPPVVELPKFNDAKTINIAVTGDMPPLDYVAADGKAAGFNVVLLSQIANRLHVNIKLVNVETGSRAPALKSGRADGVFWFSTFEGYDKQPDLPEGVITSTPYYGWTKILFIGKK
ncbi:MAG: transporter substrate-binding domain-containing protein [Synergistaceae bacterium]|nr:transporter substrate-binding domain-containing protein [Synergistaceae bacterium]